MKTQTILRKTLVVAFLIILSGLFLNSYSQENYRANLKIVNPDGTSVLVDGNMTNYDPGYSNAVDGMDVWKMTNFGENFGIYREAQNFVVERRRTIIMNDTTYFRMWNMRQLNYLVEVVMKNLDYPGVTAYMEDLYLNKYTQLHLDDTTFVPFTITSDPASANQFRFRIVFVTEMSGTMPLTFTSIKAWQKNGVPQVEWNVEEESAVLQYDIERSLDGLNFVTVAGTVPANNNGGNESYVLADPTGSGENLFYRVKATLASGNTLYSAIARLGGNTNDTEVLVYPNPVHGRKAQMFINNASAGKYNVSLLSGRGLVIPIQEVNLVDGSNNLSLTLPMVTPGIYRLRVAGNGVAHIVTLSIK